MIFGEKIAYLLKIQCFVLFLRIKERLSTIRRNGAMLTLHTVLLHSQPKFVWKIYNYIRFLQTRKNKFFWGDVWMIKTCIWPEKRKKERAAQRPTTTILLKHVFTVYSFVIISICIWTCMYLCLYLADVTVY